MKKVRITTIIGMDIRSSRKIPKYESKNISIGFFLIKVYFSGIIKVEYINSLNLLFKK